MVEAPLEITKVYHAETKASNFSRNRINDKQKYIVKTDSKNILNELKCVIGEFSRNKRNYDSQIIFIDTENETNENQGIEKYKTNYITHALNQHEIYIQYCRFFDNDIDINKYNKHLQLLLKTYINYKKNKLIHFSIFI